MIQARIGRISYINVAPVYYGLDRGLAPAWMSMITRPPAVLNAMLEDGQIDLSPVSSAAYAKNSDQWYLLPDLSISSFGEVMSVILVSRVQFSDLDQKTIALSRESASAAALVRILADKNGIKPHTVVQDIKQCRDVSPDADAALIIGDAALIENWSESFAYIYDLGDLWKSLTGLPFVYAVWAIRKQFAESNKRVVRDIIRLFQTSKKDGRANQANITQHSSTVTGLSEAICDKYFHCLNCDLTSFHLKGLQTYYQYMYESKLIQTIPEIRFIKEDGTVTATL